MYDNSRNHGLGSPPRVRSRLAEVAIQLGNIGITSACAEQTSMILSSSSATGDHLRVCGADLREIGQETAQQGSPPRVRSRRWCAGHSYHRQGITSACAEQTLTGLSLFRRIGDHLRVCGADCHAWIASMSLAGSPPRVRSRPVWPRPGTLTWGITSACAEQTCHACRWWRPYRDHLRVCGADL